MNMGAGTKLRQVLAKNGLVEAMAAHSPLSAMLAAEAGFDAIWASGFELSAMYGVPDVSVVSMTQHLDMTRAMVDRSGLPVVADIDTGFGNAINVLYAIEQYERAGAAAIVMEDKSFPKVTSLIAGGRQDMVRVEEFQGKIEAALAARRDPDLLIVARTEALIAGLGQDEALKRARAYEAAGADMILVHHGLFWRGQDGRLTCWLKTRLRPSPDVIAYCCDPVPPAADLAPTVQPCDRAPDHLGERDLTC
jgi:phosphoenolpyruvate phosphomutase